MKWTVLLLALLIIFIPMGYAFAQDTEDGMVKTAARDIQLGPKWKLGPTITIPPFRVQESVRENAKLDIVVTASFGGGIAFVYEEEDPITGDKERIFSVSPFTILLSGDSTEDYEKLDLSYCVTIGLFDDMIMTGVGYNFGKNIVTFDDGTDHEISRWFYLLGFGVTFGS